MLSDISSRAKILLTEMFGISPEALKPESSLNTDLGLDSIDTIDLLTTLNDEFNLDLSPFDFEGCELLNDFLLRLEETAKIRSEKAGLSNSK